MSLDEINEILEYKRIQNRESWERLRATWFHTYRAFGCDYKDPADIGLFPWEKKESKRLTKSQVKKRNKDAEQWLERKKLI
jgi:hypothetical protein